MPAIAIQFKKKRQVSRNFCTAAALMALCVFAEPAAADVGPRLIRSA
jgi:hypothetical protein